MSKNRKHIIWKSILGLLIVAVLVASYILGSDKRRQRLCSRVDITILDSLSQKYITTEDIRQHLSSDYGTVVGTAVDSIDLYKIENILNGKDGILKSEAYVRNDGSLKIDIQQRTPIIQFQTRAYGFYCDCFGVLFPMLEDFTCEALIVGGHIPLDVDDCINGSPVCAEDGKWLDEIIEITWRINSSGFLKEKIAKILIAEDGQLSIIPKEGGEKFLFGHLTDVETKFEKIQIYYEMIAPAKEEGKYEVVDLRYNKQIVCK